jgi:glycosyltransferase involved in cell wall biosynthesis
VRHGLTSATTIFTRTPDTARILSRSMRKKSINFVEVMVECLRPPRPQRLPGPPRLLFAGRLLYWKGAHIAIEALAGLMRVSPGAQLTIVGKGSEEERLRSAAAARGVTDNVRFVPWLPQQELFDLYQSHDLFVFPSMHDSGGTVVVEALSFGLPVVCLDIGGPAQIVTPSSGVIVSTVGRNTAQLAAAMANEIVRLSSSQQLLEQLSDGAKTRAGQFAVSDRVEAFYGMVAEVIADATPAEKTRQSAAQSAYVG